MKYRTILHITIYLILLLSISSLTSGIIISGEIYDASFNIIEKSLVSINTTPIQKIIAHKNYTFNIPPGKYLITAQINKNNENYIGKEEVVIPNQNTNSIYQRDIILFADLSEEYDLINEEALNEIIEIDDSYTKFYYQPQSIIFMIIWIITIVFILKAFSKQQEKHKTDEKEIESVVKKEISDLKKEINTINKKEILIRKELDPYIKFIAKEKQLLQKNFKKEFPMSDAKASLIISELEELGIVKKIKKGRGNILTYNKK